MTGEKCYCRYCSNAMLRDDNLIYCIEKDMFFEGKEITRMRSCKSFDFNPIDVLYCDPDKKYKPREPKPKADVLDQISLEEV